MKLKTKIAIGLIPFIILLAVAILLSYIFETIWIAIIYLIVSAIVFAIVMFISIKMVQKTEDLEIDIKKTKKRLKPSEISNYVKNYFLEQQNEMVITKAQRIKRVGNSTIARIIVEGKDDYEDAVVLLDTQEPEETLTILEKPSKEEIEEAMNDIANIRIETKIKKETTQTPIGQQEVTTTEKKEEDRQDEIDRERGAM